MESKKQAKNSARVFAAGAAAAAAARLLRLLLLCGCVAKDG